MRLTLRTLLAYLDRILDEEDTRELENKIKESERASQLVQRITKVLAQRRSDSISIDATGVGQDANSVAEYLDNTLPPEQVPQFEQVSLDSDTHLAEVAACHQILTLVLGEPAEVPNDLKHRMYQLRASAAGVSPSPSTSADAALDRFATENAVHRVDATEAQPGSTVDRATQQPNQPTPSKPTPSKPSPAPRATAPPTNVVDEDERWTEAPDYLKRPQPSRWKPLLLATSIAFCLAMAAIFSQPLDQTHPLANWLGLASVVPDGELEVDDPPPLPSDTPVPQSPSDGLVDDLVDDAPQVGDLEPLDGDDAFDSTETSADQETRELDDVGPETDTDLANDASDESVIDRDAPLDVIDEPIYEESTVADPSDVATSDADTTTSVPGADDFEPLPLDAPNNLDAEIGDSFDPPVTPNLEDVAVATPNPTRDQGDDFSPNGDLEIPEAADDASAIEAPNPPSITDPRATSNPPARDDAVGLVPVMPNTSRADSETASDSDTVSAVPTKPPVTDVGRFLDEQQVLIHLDASDRSWRRVPSGEPLKVGDTLVSLPTFRTPLALSSGMQVTMVGATQLRLLPTDDEQSPVFGIDYGRLVLATFTQTGTSFTVKWGDSHSAELTVTDMNTNLAIEAKRVLVPGSDPEKDAGHDVFVVHVTSGGVEFQAVDGAAIQVATGRRLAIIDERAPRLDDAESVPGWIDGSDAAPRDPIAAGGLSKKLVTDRPATLVLLEEADDNSRYQDIRSLAVCSLAQFGQYDPLLVALNDSDLRSYWSSQYEVLATLVGRSPEIATAVKAAMIDFHGDEEGKHLFRMLWGYSPLQLENGGGQALVDYLDHAETDFRLIASECLKQITGANSLYRAFASERNPQRRAAINRWRKMLEEGKIVYAKQPFVVELLATSAAPEASTAGE